MKNLFLLTAVLLPLAIFGKSPQGFIKDIETNIKKPLEIRDPFKRTVKKKKQPTSTNQSYLKNGVFSNVPSLEGKPLSKIVIKGVLVGKERRAIAKIGNETFVIKEGMLLGENNAEVKAILPAGIVLVEKIKNVYNQDEYLETILPVASDKTK